MSVLSKRQLWMVDRVSNAFGIDAPTVEKCMRDNKKKIEGFLANEPGSSPKLFFFYQPHQSSKPELFLLLSKSFAVFL
jgi:hypothetical protein